MLTLRSGFAGLAAAVVLLGATGAEAVSLISLDRRFPTAYCPIDNDSFNLSFTATTDRVKIKISGNNFVGTGWLTQRLDNMIIVPKSVFDANRNAPVFSSCYQPPGPANYHGYNFSVAGTTENFLDLFDANAAAWDLTNYGWWEAYDAIDDPFASAPRNSTSNTDRTGGALALGRQEDGAVTVSTDFTVTGLTPGTLYVLTGWWSTENLNTLLVTIDTNPCVDADGDGVTDCAGDCNDADPKMRPGLAEVCDGRDNDCNGAIDDAAACVRVCTTPSKLGTDVRVTTAVFDSSAPSIAWNGIDYGMLWKDSRNGDQEIFFTHMTPAGTKVGGDISVTGACSDCVNPRLVWSGTEYGAVWSQGGSITFRRLDRAGAPIGSATPLIDPAGSSADEPDIVWTGTEYGVVWNQFVGPQQIRFARLDREGNTLSRILHVTDDASFFGNARPRVAFGGGKYGITWQGNTGGQPEIFFERVDPRQGPALPATQITTHNSGAFHPQIAWNGSEWGIAWEDHQSFTEIYFQRVSSLGVKVGNNVRITNAAGVSNEPTLAWTGSEYGVVWDDDRSGNLELWYARISAAGAKIVSEIQLTNDPGTTDMPALAWGGSKFAVAFHDDRFAGESEILFLRFGCNCVDGDLDGSSSCVDCDDTRAAVFGGAPQICDGLNNDCNSTTWPLLTGTNEVDGDADGFAACADCNDANGAVWATPGEVRSLVLTHTQATSTTTLSWNAPLLPGATSFVYDTLRSPTPSNFTSSATCVESNDGSNASAVDTVTPTAGNALFFLVRAENACPSGQGVLGRNGAGAPVAGRTCP